MKYDFDKIIDRRATNSLNVDGYVGYIFGGEKLPELKYKEEQLIRLWVADMDFETAPSVVEALRSRVEHKIFGYTKIFEDEFLNSFKNWCKVRYGWEFDNAGYTTSAGVIPALYNLVGAICEPDEKVIFFTPSYAYFKKACDINNIEYVCSDLIKTDGYYTIDFLDFEQKLKTENIKCCIFCNPHNPTGRVWTESELLKVGQLCKQYNVVVVSDEIHCDLLRNKRQHTPLAKVMDNDQNVLTCMAASKTFNLAGLQLSSLIIPNSDILEKYNATILGMENPLSIQASLGAYSGGMDWVEQLNEYIDKNFEYLQQSLKQHLPLAKFTVPEATYLAWVDVSPYIEKGTNIPYHMLVNTGVIVEGGSMFVQNGDGMMRLNLACPKSVLEEGIERICEFLKKS